MSKINDVIQKMNDKEYRAYFFRNSPNYQNLDLWFGPLMEKEYFFPENNPEPIEEDNKGYYRIPHWEVLDFIEAVSRQNKDVVKDEITDKLVDVVNSIIDYRKVDGSKVDNYHTDWYMVKVIFNLPIDRITLAHIDFIGTSLRDSRSGGSIKVGIEKVVMPVLLENAMKKHLLNLIKIIFAYRSFDKTSSYQEREPLVEKYWLKSLLEKYSVEMIKLINIDGLEVLIDIIKTVISEDHGTFNDMCINMYIDTIENHLQNGFKDSYNNQLVSFIRNLLESLSSEQIKDKIKLFLEEEAPIFKRFAFHIINQKYDDLKDLFWEWFDNEIYTINTTFRHEFYKLLEDRSSQFDEEEFNKLIDWIEELDYSEHYQNEELAEYTAYQKKEWLLCLKADNNKAKNLYDKYNEIYPHEIEHPGFDSWFSGFVEVVGNESSIDNIDKFCELAVDEQIVYIKKFNPLEEAQGSFTTDDDLQEGLAKDFAKCVRKNPEKYINEIEKIHDLEYLYKYYVLDGFLKVWIDKQKFDWGKLFDFILDELNNDFFQSSEKYVSWFKGEVAELIQKGTEKDSNAFSKDHLPKAKEILFKLIDNKEDEEGDYFNDLSTHLLNSNNGKVLHALMNYALRYGRLNSSTKVKWEPEIKYFFSNELNQYTDYSKSIFTILGEYLAQLRFLDLQWVNDNFNKIFPLDNNELWDISITGYFLYADKVYTDIYALFKEKEHIKKALSHDFNSDKVKNRIIRHICVMFIGDDDGSTIDYIIKSKNSENILEIINFISKQASYKDEQLSAKVSYLWGVIYNIYKDDCSDEAKNIFSVLSKWFIFLDHIDAKVLPYLKLTAKYTKEDYSSSSIVEELARLVEVNPKYVGELYLDILGNGIFPEYKKEDIKEIVKGLYKHGESDNGLKICNLYRRKGIYFLNDLGK